MCFFIQILLKYFNISVSVVWFYKRVVVVGKLFDAYCKSKMY